MSILRLAAITALGAVALAVHAPATLCAADPLKDEAVARLAASHDPAIPIAIGRVYVKQAALESARALLAERGKAAGLNAGWGPGAPEWQAAEVPLTGIIDGIIARQVDDPAWFREAWGREAARVLNADAESYPERPYPGASRSLPEDARQTLRQVALMIIVGNDDGDPAKSRIQAFARSSAA
jgi:hypothetical protein